MTAPKLVPELQCADFARSLTFYTDVLGFEIAFDRPEDDFAYLDLGGAELMLEDQTETWSTGALAHPYGRGLNLQIEVADVGALHDAVLAAGHPIFVALEDCWYRMGDQETGMRQFLIQDPDGYLLRFFQDLGTRPIANTKSR